MDTKFQTSFIPKKPLVPSIGIGKSGRHVSFFSIIIIFVFLVSLLGATAVFVYEKYLTTRIANMQQSLAQAEASLDPALISEWVRLDKRIESSKEILNVHVALSSFFDILQDMTLKNVQFKNFGYIINSSQKINIAMDGVADSFATVALQSDEFAKKAKSIGSQLFSNIDLDRSGNVNFRFTATLDPALILYKNTIQNDTSREDQMPSTIVDPTNTATSTQ